MKLIFVEKGFEISLDSSVIEYTRTSSLFNQLIGEWSYPFTIRATAEILANLNYPNLPNTQSSLEKTYLVQLVEGSLLYAEGDFVVQYADDEIITSTLTATPGNISKKIWNKKMNTFNLGGDVIPTQSLNNTIYSIDAVEKLGMYDGLGFTGTASLNTAIERIFFKFNVVFKTGSTVHLEATIEPTHAERVEGSYSIFQKVLDNYNTSQTNHEILYNQKQLIAIFTGSFTAPLEIKFTFYSLFGDSIEMIYNFSINPQNIVTITNYLNNSLGSLWTKPYQLPEIINSKLYNESTIFNGIINKTDGGNILRNTSIMTEKTKYSLVPMLHLKWVLESIFGMFGYTITGNFLVNPDIQKLLIFNLFTTDKLVNNISYPINIHNPIITYANHLPSQTLGEYVQALIDEFGIAFEFNILTKTLDISFMSDILNDSDVLDLTGRMSRKRRNNLIKAKKTQVKWTLSGDSLAKDTANPYLPVPLDAIVEENKDDFQPVDMKIPGLTGDSNKRPKIEASGITPLFSQTDNSSPLRFIFWDGNVGKIETDTLGFDLTTNKGILQKFLKTKTDFIDNTLNIEVAALLSLDELISFKLRRKILGFGLMWLTEEIAVKLKTGQTYYFVELKLKRLNYY